MKGLTGHEQAVRDGIAEIAPREAKGLYGFRSEDGAVGSCDVVVFDL